MIMNGENPVSRRLTRHNLPSMKKAKNIKIAAKTAVLVLPFALKLNEFIIFFKRAKGLLFFNGFIYSNSITFCFFTQANVRYKKIKKFCHI